MPDWYARIVLQLVASASQTSSASVGADADLARSFGGLEARAGGTAAVHRTADGNGGAFTIRGGLHHPEVMRDGDLSFAPAHIEHTVELSALPSLSARRDHLRAAYDRTSTTIWIDLLHVADVVTASLMPIELTISRDAQSGYRREELHLGMAAFRWCHTRWCLNIVDAQIASSDGALSAGVVRFAPVSIDHVAVDGATFDAWAGLAAGSMDVPGAVRPPDTRSDVPCDQVGTCVMTKRFAYDVAARTTDTATELALHARRAMYPTMVGELALEDRAEATLRRALGRTTVAARAFVARTRWWALDVDRLDPLGADVTGGGDLTASRAISDWTLDLSLAAARSFYAAQDGGGPRAGLGAQGTVSLSRQLERTW